MFIFDFFSEFVEMDSDKIFGIIFILVFDFLFGNHCVVHIRIFTDKEFEFCAVLLQKFFQVVQNESHSGNIPKASCNSYSVDTDRVDTFFQCINHFEVGGIVD